MLQVLQVSVTTVRTHDNDHPSHVFLMSTTEFKFSLSTSSLTPSQSLRQRAAHNDSTRDSDLHMPASLTSQKKSSKKKKRLPLFLNRSARLSPSR